MHQHFFDHVNILPDRIHIPDGSDPDADKACLEYDHIISSIGGIDLQLLGIGNDGHIGFNEPGTAFEMGTHCVNLSESTITANQRFFRCREEVPKKAYTMGIKTIMQSRKVLLIAGGSEKAEILHQALFGPVTPQNSRINSSNASGLHHYRRRIGSSGRSTCRMKIINADVYCDDHHFHKREIEIRNGMISSLHEPSGGKDDVSSSSVIDAEGLFAIPGLVDIHLHGAVGHDFCDAEESGISAIAEYEASKGILAICPATMSFDEKKLTGIMECAGSYIKKDHTKGADLIGINMEGPFLNPDKSGAQDSANLQRPDAEMFRRLQRVSDGLIRLVDIAPEIDGAMEFIDACKNEVNISLAHTCAGYETASLAFRMGMKHVTHLFNAMPDLSHRSPGPVAAALENDAEAELISDGVHVHPAMVRLAFRSFPEGKIILISDSMMACGLQDGSYTLGGLKVSVKGSRAVLTDHPETIAGSVTCLYDDMRLACRMGVPLETAVRASSENPARSIGADARYGIISPGHYGNILLIDRDLNLIRIIQKGRILS